jgi:hypothetical protein
VALPIAPGRVNVKFVTRELTVACELIRKRPFTVAPFPFSVIPFVSGIVTTVVQVAEQGPGSDTVSPLVAKLIAAWTSVAEHDNALTLAALVVELRNAHTKPNRHRMNFRMSRALARGMPD